MFPYFSKDLVMNAKDELENDKLVQASIRDEIAMKKGVFVDLWGAKSPFHTGLVQIPIEGMRESESEDEEGMPLTEEEKLYFQQAISESKAELAINLVKEKGKGVNKFYRNVFLPIAPSRWIEGEAMRCTDKIRDLDTFNHSAPLVNEGCMTTDEAGRKRWVPNVEMRESESEDEEGMPLTEEEKLYFQQMISESKAELGINLAKEKGKGVNKFYRNVFLPIAPSRWIEGEAMRCNDKILDLDTFDHSARLVSMPTDSSPRSQKQKWTCVRRRLLEPTRT
ncbi:hypothetical protein CBR_g40102 [Chara braunii]|uniref:Uncharacterized protein n=1 Tax=Chara braunii TaxID=69332 RepID=A0A388LT09_CHABU|nr:hypothetical protein CBR_g40102 [Chara braunii]|eukprot:GBG85460.1 hypothetical protein CBR_g40102 [Chara braunii]